MSEEAAKLHSATPTALPVGTRLLEFEVLRLLGVGGFGIVYLAFDHDLEREVAVKEYMPAALAGRTETLHVSLRSQSDAENFALGLKSFVNEARLLARFDHPALLKVHRFWEANGTAYMAMPVLRGQTAKAWRQAAGTAPDEAWLRRLLMPLLGAIEKLHEAGVYHRDIAPDNIQIEADGQPVLLDFGAARRVLSDKSQALTAILKPAYAPIEQYAEAGSVKQGPWTDLYALGATLHFLLLQRPPPPATARAVHDEPSALTVASLSGCSEDFLRTIDWMLAPKPADRPQSVAALREVLEGRAPVPLRRPVAEAASEWEQTVRLPRNTPAQDDAPTVKWTRPDAEPAETAAPAAPALATTGADVPPAASAAGFNRPKPGPTAGEAASVKAPARQRAWMGGVGLLVLAALAYGLLARAPTPAPSGVAPDVAASAGSGASAPGGDPVASAALPAMPAVAESTVASVVLPGAGGTPRAVGAAASPTGTPPPKTAPVAPRPLSPAANAVTSGATPGTPTAGATTAAEPPRRPAEGGTAGNTTPSAGAAGGTVGAAGLVSSAPANPKPVAAGPEAVCSGRNFLRHFACMERECLKTANQAHPDCKQWRAAAPKSEP